MSKSSASGDKRNATILFVDDEPLSLKYFQASVGKYANVRTASSPDAALEILENEGDDIAVVVSDERMPRESGVSFLSDVRKSWPSTIRVLTSAYANIDNLQDAINHAAIYRFVPKPWNLDELCEAMRDALDVERSATALAEPVFGASQDDGDAKDANLALLAILASGLDAPLNSLAAESAHLARLSGRGSLHIQSGNARAESLSCRLCRSTMAADSGQILQDVEQCRSIASSIGKLARSLASPAAVQASSMADTLVEVIDQSMSGLSKDLSLDTSHDFTYRMPREIMKFVLSNLLRGSGINRRDPVAQAEISLFNGAAHNEVRLSLQTANTSLPPDNHQTWRTIRSALWAFGGELLSLTDENSGKSTLILCLPNDA